MSSNFKRNFVFSKFDGNIGDAVYLEEILCDEVETVREFAYLGNRVKSGGVCEAVVTVNTKCGWTMWNVLSYCVKIVFP